MPDLDAKLGEARERGRKLAAEILSGREMLDADAFAECLEITEAAIDGLSQTRQIIGLKEPAGHYRFPAWQIAADGQPFAALPRLFEALGGGSWAVYRFLMQRHDAMEGMTGVEALQRGHDAAAIAAAEGIAESAFA